MKRWDFFFTSICDSVETWTSRGLHAIQQLWQEKGGSTGSDINLHHLCEASLPERSHCWREIVQVGIARMCSYASVHSNVFVETACIRNAPKAYDFMLWLQNHLNSTSQNWPRVIMSTSGVLTRNKIECGHMMCISQLHKTALTSG